MHRRRGGRLQLVDEQPQLALLARERTLDGEQPVVRRGRHVLVGGNRLQLEADAGQRLQDAVVQIARQAQAIFAHGELAQPLGYVQLVERVPDLARDDFYRRK